MTRLNENADKDPLQELAHLVGHDLSDNDMEEMFDRFALSVEDEVRVEYLGHEGARTQMVDANSQLLAQLEQAIKDNNLLSVPCASVIVEMSEHADLADLRGALEFLGAANQVEFEEGEGFPFLAVLLPERYVKISFNHPDRLDPVIMKPVIDDMEAFERVLDEDFRQAVQLVQPIPPKSFWAGVLPRLFSKPRLEDMEQDAAARVPVANRAVQNLTGFEASVDSEVDAVFKPLRALRRVDEVPPLSLEDELLAEFERYDRPNVNDMMEYELSAKR